MYLGRELKSTLCCPRFLQES